MAVALIRRVHAFEWSAAAALALCLAALAAAGQPIAPGSVPETLGWMARSALPALLLGIALQALYAYADGQDPRDALRMLRAARGWAGWLRLWLACWLASFAYFWLKVYVPRLNGARFDGALEAADRALHLGASPTRVALEWLGGVSGWLDVWYAAWLVSLVWCLAFFAASPQSHVRRGVVLSCVLLWLTGSWLYVLLPAVGPAFAFPGLFDDLAERMPRAAAAQAALWENYRLVLAGAGPGSFQHTLGVAALPSLHVGFHALFTLWARVAAPLLFGPFLLATLLTFAGSLVSGWHYAVDGYLGAALAAACFALARRLEPGEAAPDAAAATRAAS